MDTNSSTFSSWGKWPQLLIISRQDPGMAHESLSEFHGGTSRSLSPVIISTEPQFANRREKPALESLCIHCVTVVYCLSCNFTIICFLEHSVITNPRM